MKRILIISALLLAVVLTATADRRRLMMARNVAAGCSTVALNVTTDDNASTVGASSAQRYGGGLWAASSSGSVCKVRFKLTATGTISGLSYTVRIYSLSGNNLDTLLGTSDAVTGVDAWSATNVDFTFASPVSVSSGTSYGVVITSGANDAANYISIRYQNSNAADVDLARWNSTLVNSDLFTGLAPVITITFQ